LILNHLPPFRILILRKIVKTVPELCQINFI
jgi:hypothetical protein